MIEGLITQEPQTVDAFFTTEITDHLFQKNRLEIIFSSLTKIKWQIDFCLISVITKILGKIYLLLIFNVEEIMACQDIISSVRPVALDHLLRGMRSQLNMMMNTGQSWAKFMKRFVVLPI